MLRVAVIGLGNIATRHRRNLKLLFPKCVLYAMSASGRNIAKGISDCDKIVLSISEIIESKIQLVIVASPSPLHATHALPLISAGIPTLIEKPVTANVNDAQLLKDAITKYNTPVAVGYCLRYLPSAQIIKRLLEEEKVGVLYNAFIQTGQYLPDWRPNKNYINSVSANLSLGGGALLELSHELDYCQWLLGELKIEHVISRSTKELGLSVEDIVDITITTSTGIVGHIHLDFVQRKAHRVCSFIGSQGRLDWDLINNSITFVNHECNEVLYSEPNLDKNKLYIDMLENFLEMIKGNNHQCVTVCDASETIELIERIRIKAK
jgi:predicted dehydrogenase